MHLSAVLCAMKLKRCDKMEIGAVGDLRKLSLTYTEAISYSFTGIKCLYSGWKSHPLEGPFIFYIWNFLYCVYSCSNLTRPNPPVSPFFAGLVIVLNSPCIKFSLKTAFVFQYFHCFWTKFFSVLPQVCFPVGNISNMI